MPTDEAARYKTPASAMHQRQKPKNAFVGWILNLQKILLPGSPLDDPYVIDKEIFFIPFFTGNFFENF